MSVRALAVAVGALAADWRAGSGEGVLRSETASLDGAEIQVAELELGEPAWDPDGANRGDVLVETEAWSCNYRDGGLIQMALAAGRDGFYVIGSELSGIVAAVGAEVAAPAVGERVMIDSCYGPGEREPWGMPTNHASRSRQTLPAAKVRSAPEAMDATTAAGFSLGAQTSAAMARRAGVGPGDEVLVCSSRSVTSLFCIQTLADLGASVTAWTSSGADHRLLESLGAGRVVVSRESLGALAREIGGFAAVLDPFADLNMGVSVRVAAHGAPIVTCGATRGGGDNLEPVMGSVVRKQLRLVGSCLGTSADLEAGIERWTRGALRVPLGRVLAPGDGPAAVIDATFGTKPVPGKVVVSCG